jgi:hypothetical protein
MVKSLLLKKEQKTEDELVSKMNNFDISSG